MLLSTSYRSAPVSGATALKADRGDRKQTGLDRVEGLRSPFNIGCGSPSQTWDGAWRVGYRVTPSKASFLGPWVWGSEHWSNNYFTLSLLLLLAHLSFKTALQDRQHLWCFQFSSVAQSCLTLWPHELQHARPPCPWPTPGTYSNSCPLSWGWHPTISSSVVPFSSCLQSFPASGSFPVSQFFASGGQSIGVSASVSVLPMNIQNWSPLGWTGWLSLQSKELSRVFSNTTVQKHQFWCFRDEVQRGVEPWLGSQLRTEST